MNAVELRAAWTTSYINNLPDSAFAVIESGGERDSSGKTTPRSLRHLPHHDGSGKLDAPHVRNGLARVSQMSLSDALKARGERHLRSHANDMGIGKEHSHDPDDGESFADQIERVLLEVQGVVTRSENVSAMRAKAGRRLNDARIRDLTAIYERIGALLDWASHRDESADDKDEDDAKDLVPPVSEQPPVDVRSDLERMRDHFLSLDAVYAGIERTHREQEKLHVLVD